MAEQTEPRWASLQAYQVPGAPDCAVASWSGRVPGFILDIVIAGCVYAAVSLCGYLFVVVFGEVAWIAVALLAGTIIVGFILFNKVYLVATRGATIGQKVTKLRVISAGGQQLPLHRAFLRFLLEAGFVFIPFMPLVDLLWPVSFLNPNNNLAQTLHDKAVGSYVVHA